MIEILDDPNEDTQGRKPAPRTQQELIQAKVLAVLDELGAHTVGEDSLVFQGDRFVLPANMQGQLGTAVKYLRDYEKQQESEFEFARTFNFRPWDGANAFQRAMKRLFGTTGVGVTIQTLFGDIKPQYHDINVGPTETIQVPWRRVGFSPLSATFDLGTTHHEDYGVVFQLSVTCPRKYRTQVAAFFQVVEDELKTNSIYRGKAFTGGGMPLFLDLGSVDPDRVVYSDEVMTQLDTNMWSLLEYSNQMRTTGMPLKRAVLVEGPYGTGKTLAGYLTAKKAVENGWTFILARPGKDDLMEVLQTAQLYAPAVVWYEDIDVVAAGTSDMQISRLLDVLDGITNKGVEVLAGFTTNHVSKIQKGVLRPGRLDAVVHIGELDRDGFEKLVRVTVPADRLGDIDFDQIGDAFHGLLPAFAKEAIDRAMRYNISRNKGHLSMIETVDLVNAAHGLRPQLQLMEDAQEGVRRPILESALTGLIQRTVAHTVGGAAIIDGDGDPVGGGWKIVDGDVLLESANGHV